MEIIIALLMAWLAFYIAAWAIVLTMIGLVRCGLWLTLQLNNLKRKLKK